MVNTLPNDHVNSKSIGFVFPAKAVNWVVLFSIKGNVAFDSSDCSSIKRVNTYRCVPYIRMFMLPN